MSLISGNLYLTFVKMEVMQLSEWKLECGLDVAGIFQVDQVYKQGARGSAQSLGARGEHGDSPSPGGLCCPLVVAAFHAYAAESSIFLLRNEFPRDTPPSLPPPFLENVDKACVLIVY